MSTVVHVKQYPFGMRIADMNWMQVEELLKTEDRCVLPLGSTEQHAYLSLFCDGLLAERMAVEAAAPLGVPVFPVVPFGMTAQFMAYPGTINLHFDVYAALLKDVLESLWAHGFRRVFVVNGHGGNVSAAAVTSEWAFEHEGMKVKWHDWWRAPETWGAVAKVDRIAMHASWMENFPWTRLRGVNMPEGGKEPAVYSGIRLLSPRELRQKLGDGNFGGLYQREDEDMRAIWDVAVEETRKALEEGW